MTNFSCCKIKKLLGLAVCVLVLFSSAQPITAEQDYPFTWCLSPSSYTVSERRVKIATLPHHGVAKTLWQPIFDNWRHHNVKKIILLAPDHNWKGTKGITTVTNSISSSGSTLPVDGSVEKLINSGLATAEKTTIEADHSVTVFIPELTQSLPEITLLPLLLKKNISSAEITALSTFLNAELKDEDTVVLASIDFSHYLLPAVAYRKDTEMIEMVMNNDQKKISALSDNYLDAPSVLIVSMKLAAHTQKELTLIWQGHAGQFLHTCFQPTTSYQVWTVLD